MVPKGLTQKNNENQLFFNNFVQKTHENQWFPMDLQRNIMKTTGFQLFCAEN